MSSIAGGTGAARGAAYIAASMCYTAALLLLVVASIMAWSHFTVDDRTMPYLAMAGGLAALAVLHVGIARAIERGWGLRVAGLGLAALVGAARVAMLLGGGGSSLFVIPPAFAVVLGWWRFLWPTRT